MANFFDQFDPEPAAVPKAPATAQTSPSGSNFFDQFDPVDAKSAAPAAASEGKAQVPEVVDIDDLPNGHGGSFMSGIVHGLGSALTLPGDVATGKVDYKPLPSDTEDLTRVADLAGVMAPNPVAGGYQYAARAAPQVAIESSAAAAAPALAVRQAAENIGVDLPRVASTDSMALQRLGAAVKNIPLAGDPLVRRSDAAINGLGEAVDRTAAEFGGSTGYNAGHRVGQVLGDAAEAETAAATRSAQATDAAATKRWEQGQSDATASIEAAEQAARQRAQDAVGSTPPGDMGATVTQTVRDAEQAARAEKERLYGVAGNTEASIEAGSVREVRARVAQALEDDGWRIDPTLTPAASKMMDELSRLSDLKLPNKAIGTRPPGIPGEEPQIAGVSLAGIESSRKALGNMARAATNDADRTAAKTIMRQFDGWLDDAFDGALYSGGEEALGAIKAARAANADWRSRFGFNPKADADRMLNRIATGEVTPQETANWIVGAGKVGAQGSSARLIDRIRTATGDSPEALDSIRGAVWHRLTDTAEGVDPKGALRVANDIREFLGGSGKEVAGKLFDRDQQAVMGAYADAVRIGQAARQRVTDVAREIKPEPTKVDIGPMQELANTVLGKQGGRSDEAIFKAVQAYSQEGGTGNLQVLGRLVRALPEDVKGDLAGSMIRKMGVSPRSKDFSADVWLSNWNKTTPEAKTLLFGNAGSTRAALDDIATVSSRMKDLQRFGNPSGTTQTMTGAATFGGAMLDPVSTIAIVLGGRVAAEILSRPVTVSRMARWSRAYEQVVSRPSVAAISAFTGASKALAGAVGAGGAPLLGEGIVAEVRRLATDR